MEKRVIHDTQFSKKATAAKTLLSSVWAAVTK